MRRIRCSAFVNAVATPLVISIALAASIAPAVQVEPRHMAYAGKKSVTMLSTNLASHSRASTCNLIPNASRFCRCSMPEMRWHT